MSENTQAKPRVHHCSISCNHSLCVVTRLGSLNPPELHLAVYHGGHPDICDACSLQAHCDELFGPRGRDCQIFKAGNRWVRVTHEQQQQLHALIEQKGSHGQSL